MSAIVYIDRSTIRSPDVAGLRHAVAELVDFIRDREPQLLFYGFEIDEAAATMHVVAVHPDAASLELHLALGGPAFRKVGAYIDLQEIDVFGDATDRVREQLAEKAATLGTAARVHVGEVAPGFERLTPPRA